MFDAWHREQEAGRDCLMLAPTHELVRQLNERARFARLRDTTVGDQVRLRDGTHASVADVVLTRHNDLRLGVSSTDWVKNGDRWTVTGIHNDALLGDTATPGSPPSCPPSTSPPKSSSATPPPSTPPKA